MTNTSMLTANPRAIGPYEASLRAKAIDARRRLFGASKPRAVLAIPRPMPLSPFHPDRQVQPAAELPVEQVAEPAVITKLPPWRVILNEVAERHQVSVSDILGKQRFRVIVHARQECCYRMSMECGMSLPAVGRRMGVDHTTVLYAIKVHLQRHPELRPIYADHLGAKASTRRSLYREAVQMYFDDNRTVPEIMRELGIDRNMVNSFIRSEVRKVRAGHAQEANA